MRNRLQVRLRRLREPKYLIGTMIGLAYFGFIFFGRGGGSGSPGLMWAIGKGRGLAELAVATFLFGTSLLAWVWPRSKPALPFTLPEVQHLFPAPIARRDLVRYRVLRSQVGTLFAGAIMAIIFRPGSGLEGLTVFLGISLVMATLNLHMTGIALSRARRGASYWTPVAMVGAAVASVAGTVLMNWGELAAAAISGESLGSEIERLGTTGAIGVILWPFRAVARVPMAQSVTAFLMALPAALALLLLNYMWVIRTDTPFEEASAELSEKIDKIRRGGMKALHPPRVSKRTPFTLAPHGRPEIAILWKNLISMGRVYSWVMLLRVLPILLFVAAMLSRGRGGTADGLAVACVFGAGLALLLGPQIARSDLRQDLTALATLKTWPIRGAALVRGEILAPACVLTAIASLALITAAVLTTNSPFGDLATRWSLLVAALCVAPGIVLTQLLAQNGLAVTFPSWVAIGNEKSGGVDVIGQRMLVMIGVALALAVSLIPALIVAAVGAGILYLFTGTVSVALAGALAGAALLAEAFAGSEVIGAILERSDISVLDAPEA
jgi:hypothetical protein